MNDEIKRIPGTLHRATQPACSHWAPVVQTVVAGADAGTDELTAKPKEGPVADPDLSAA
jgi:hypothetical protein